MEVQAVYSRRVLLLVSGLSPQIVTETLYSVAVQRKPPFVPTEVRLATTAEGAERAWLSLLSSDPGWFARLCREYELPPIRFDESCIEVLVDAECRPMADIRSAADSELAANQIAELVRELTADPSSAVHVSIAGGRKTMSFCAGYALSLFGRPQDRMSHVLVSSPYESHPEFFYPTRQSRIIYTAPPDSRPLDTRAAEVTLAEIPFVRLRDWIPPQDLRKASTFATLVHITQTSLEPPELVLMPAERRITAGGVSVQLPPAEFAFYAWLARRRKAGQPGLECPSDGAPEREHGAGFLRESGDEPDERTLRALAQGMEKSFFLERKARLHRALQAALGWSAGPYRLQASGRRPHTIFSLSIDPERICFAPGGKEENA